MKLSGINMGRVRSQNRTAVFNYINQEGAVSRKDIAQATGLTAASVTQIVNGFIDEGVLRELGTLEEGNRVGRKKVLVDINFDYAYIWGISIETERTTIVLSNMQGAVLAQQTLESAAGSEPGAYLRKVAEICRGIAALQMRSVTQRIKAVSVGIPGIVDREKGIAVHAYGIWEESVPICEILGKALGLECVLENNVNAFAIATLYFGEGRHYDNLHVIKWGPGVGSALIIDGQIYEGRHGKAAELGHFIVEKDGKRCNCGRRGCLETKISFYALNEITHFEQDAFGDAYRKAEGQTREELTAAVDLFARSIVNSMTIMAPNRVVLTGFMLQDPLIRQELFEACRSYDASIQEKQILYTTLADKAEYIGPVAVYFQRELLRG